ncbi:MAG: hypothetical protein K8T26_10290 [Lentisphaerae bacterium]|nr:hypothetical protein [Lentisphaerota bacterium]
MRVFWLMIALVATGCELADTSAVDTGSPTSGSSGNPTSPGSPTTTVPPGLPTGTNTVDLSQAEWDAISWKTSSGPAAPGAVPVMTLSAEIFDGGHKVRFSYSHYPWSSDGLAHFFVWNGSTWEGGKFDFIRKGGQSIKLMENVYGGYNGLRVPRSGTPVAFAWTDLKGTQRSNLSKTVWP